MKVRIYIFSSFIFTLDRTFHSYFSEIRSNAVSVNNSFIRRKELVFNSDLFSIAKKICAGITLESFRFSGSIV